MSMWDGIQHTKNSKTSPQNNERSRARTAKDIFKRGCGPQKPESCSPRETPKQ